MYKQPIKSASPMPFNKSTAKERLQKKLMARKAEALDPASEMLIDLAEAVNNVQKLMQRRVDENAAITELGESEAKLKALLAKKKEKDNEAALQQT
uniref:Phage protein n=2 Tax=Bursaphelenchus xylophilus TaxID=6326 RepID=A0A1I7S6V9_BURXY